VATEKTVWYSVPKVPNSQKSKSILNVLINKIKEKKVINVLVTVVYFFQEK